MPFPSVLQVWAPFAERMEVEVNGKRHPMPRVPEDWFAGESVRTGEDRQPDGWYYYELRDSQRAVDYAYCINGGPPYADPRSPHQPRGVMGPSRTVNHEAFEWADTHWSAPPLGSAVVYEMHVGTFTPEGTFESAIGKLDHLVDVGVTHLELMPVCEFPGDRGWGYDGVDWFAPHHAYGGPDGLKRLVNACHQKGLSVIIDVVYNHFGPVGCFAGHFGPYFTDMFNTGWGKAINFGGPGSDEVRRFVIDNALMWLADYHADGLRLDAIQAIYDPSALHVLEQLAEEIDTLRSHLRRHLFVIAESDLNDPRIVRPTEIGGYGIDAQWNDDFHHSLHALLTRQRNGYYAGYGSLELLATSLRNAYVYAGTFAPHRSRRHGRPSTGLSGHSFLVYLQTHDQVGNQANGARSSMLLNIDQLKIAAALIFTSPFVPMLFQGEEWGASTPFPYFSQYNAGELADSIFKGRVEECAGYGIPADCVPDPHAIETFTAAKLNWGEMNQGWHRELLEWHRALIALRRRHQVITSGNLDNVFPEANESEQWLILHRRPFTTIANFAEEARTVPLKEKGLCVLLLASREGVRLAHDHIDMPPQSAAIIRSDAARNVLRHG